MSTTKERLTTKKRTDIEKLAVDELDDRLGSATFLRNALDHIFPDHWSFMVGEVAMYCFVILLITGIYLTLFFHASNSIVTYHGPYKPLDGQTMTEAYQSVLQISFNNRAGLVMRQTHHWAAIVFMAAVCFHLCRVFFTGAFRKPRETNWIIGFTLLTVVMLEGFTGYSLPDDLLSGTGIRVVYSIVEGLPLIGTWVAVLLFGGSYPGTDVISRMFVVHEFLFPLLIVGLLTAHLMIIWRQGHTDFPAPGKTETNIVGSRVWPQYALKSGGLLMICFAVLTALGGLVQVNPIWLYGPYKAWSVSAGSQPDWYVGWLDGALRLWPHLEFRSWGLEIPNPIFPGLVLPGIVFTLIYAWPAIDRRIYKDYEAHNLLDRPRDKPFRLAVGAAALFFFTDLTVACATDLLANNLHVGFERLIEILQYAAIFGTLFTGFVAYWAGKALQETDHHPIKRPVGGVIIRTADGGYHMLGEEHGHAAHDDAAHDDHAAHDTVVGGNGGSGNGGNGHGETPRAEEPVAVGSERAGAGESTSRDGESAPPAGEAAPRASEAAPRASDAAPWAGEPAPRSGESVDRLED